MAMANAIETAGGGTAGGRRLGFLPRRVLAGFLRPYLPPLGAAATFSLAGTALELARPWPLKLAVDHAIGGRALPHWLAPLGHLGPSVFAALAGMTVVLLVATRGVATYLADSLVGSAAERIGSDIRTVLFARLQRLSLRFHDGNRTGDLVNRLTSDVSRVQDALVAGFETLLPDLLTLTGMAVVLVAVDVQLGLVALGVAPLLAVVAGVSRHQIKRAQRRTRSLYGALASRATEIVGNVRVVQAFSREEDEAARFGAASAAVTSSAVAAVKIEARYTPLSDLVLALGSGLVLWFGVVKVARGDITVGTLLVVLAYTSSLYEPIRSLARLASVLAKGAASRERLVEVLEAADVVREAPDAVDAPLRVPRLTLDRVSFAYADTAPVLVGATLDVAAGETVCVVGASGAGKSTLLALLLRLYDPDEGSIALDGVDLRRFKLSSLRERIALVPQDAWLVDGTIAENIAFGRRHASEQQVREAARLALVDEFAARLPGGFGAVVGEGGTLLSGGQRRRIAIARAIVRGASLLVLDEPTTGLDAASRATVLGALRRVARGRTVVIVSHEPAVAALADRVVLLEAGRIAAHGPGEDLVAAEAGLGARLWPALRSAALRRRAANGGSLSPLRERR